MANLHVAGRVERSPFHNTRQCRTDSPPRITGTYRRSLTPLGIEIAELSTSDDAGV
jgi:hypothetical protein